MTPAELADLRRIAASQFMLPMMSRETLRELLAAHDANPATVALAGMEEVKRLTMQQGEALRVLAQIRREAQEIGISASPIWSAAENALARIAEIGEAEPQPAAVFIARDLCDMATTASELALVLHHVGNALGDTYVEGDPSESVCREAIKDLRDAQHRIGGLIGELEAEVG